MYDISKGLTSEQVADRERLGQSNKYKQKRSNSYLNIIRRNVFTFFNLINITLAVLILLGGINFRSLRNVLFLGVVASNTAIGLFQEIRSKHATDRLKVLTRGKVIAVRDSRETEIYTENIVLGDILILTAGSQIPADSEVAEGSCVVDESVITGEADGVEKKKGDRLISGSFVVSGTCYVHVIAVGADSYGHKIAAEARSIKHRKSDIVHTMNIILAVMSVLILPLGLSLFFAQYAESGSYADAILGTSAAVIGMLPEGMVLLTSTVFALVGIMLARHRVLSQDLYSAEALARTDVICLDKTGTLTEGKMEVADIVALGEAEDIEAELQLFIAASTDRNATANALRDRFGGAENSSLSFSPFNSDTKCSSADFGNYTLTLGAPEFVCRQIPEALKAQIDGFAETYRVLILVRSENEEATPLALVLLCDMIRPQAAKTLEYFYKEDVDVKVISGDNPKTVAAVARRAGVRGHDKYIDLSDVADEEIEAIADEYTVFGRVTPAQKRMLVAALRKAGHTVAMVGDGVNDTLALKESDCAIAPASGTDMARDAAKLVLLNSDFDSLPEVVRQGRRSINNLKRSVSLFLIKICYSLILSIAFTFMSQTYPFEPIHLTLITFVSVAVPGFLLSFEPNTNRVTGRFIADIIMRSLPGGIAIAAGVIFCALLYESLTIAYAQYVTVCVIASGITGLVNLFRICWPLSPFRWAIFTVMAGLFTVGVLIFGGMVFSLTPLGFKAIMLLICALGVSLGSYLLTLIITKKAFKADIKTTEREF